MNLGIKGKIALVAAASQGLGRAVAQGLAREGVHLAICSRRQEAVDEVAQSIRAECGVEVLAMAADVTQEAQVQAFVEAALARFGRIDICVTNCGGPRGAIFSETTTADFEQAVKLSLLSTVYFAHHVVPRMAEQGWGRFITITSTSIKQPIEGLVLSNSVRPAVAGLVKSLANEYGPRGVLVNNVCPGFTATDRLIATSEIAARREGITAEEMRTRWGSTVPLRRVGQPNEFADMVVFLASERASYITGASINIDGGAVRHIW
ncbi:MAG: SDR family oxidoreductase [Acidobacteria bacterium]|nr:SDR family oxidoreductase [Acidobacteriota bacterium]